MIRASVLALGVGLGASGAHAGAFGTADEAEAILQQIVEIIDAGGIGQAISAVHDPGQPFARSAMGIHVFADTIILADNREPELIAMSYAEVEDLTGQTMWPRIVAAAETGTPAVLDWYHYDTKARYAYRCHCAYARRAIVMVCR